MRKIVIIALFPFVLIALVGDCATFRYTEDAKISRARMDLQTIEKAVRKLAEDEKFTAEDWSKLDNREWIRPRLIERLEQGEYALVDPWNEEFIIEKRDEGERIFVTIRSSHEVKDGILGIEIAVPRADGKVIERRELWR